MEEEKNELDMDLFNEGPVIDMTGDEEVDYLFTEEESEEVENLEKDPKQTETIDNTSEDENPEEVAGEKDKEEEAEEVDTDPDGDVEDSSSNPNLFKSLATLLSEKGLISSVDSEAKIETEDDFVSLFKKQIEQSEYSDLNETQKEYLQKLREGIPHQKVEKDLYETSRLDSINEDLIKEDSDLRQRIIYQDLINKGFSEERAKKNLQRSIELEQDVEDAIDSLNSIKDFNKSRIERENEELKRQAQELQKQEEKRINSIKNKIKTSDEVIKGYKITDAVKEKIEENMFKVVGQNPENKQNENALMKYRRENPEDFDYKLYYLYTITDGFQNFESLVKNTKSTVLKDLEKAYRSSTKIKDPGSPAYLQDPESYQIDISGHEVVEN